MFWMESFRMMIIQTKPKQNKQTKTKTTQKKHKKQKNRRTNKNHYTMLNMQPQIGP